MENKDGKQKDGQQSRTFLKVFVENKGMENKNGKQNKCLYGKKSTLPFYK